MRLANPTYMFVSVGLWWLAALSQGAGPGLMTRDGLPLPVAAATPMIDYHDSLMKGMRMTSATNFEHIDPNKKEPESDRATSKKAVEMPPLSAADPDGNYSAAIHMMVKEGLERDYEHECTDQKGQEEARATLTRVEALPFLGAADQEVGYLATTHLTNREGSRLNYEHDDQRAAEVNLMQKGRDKRKRSTSPRRRRRRPQPEKRSTR